LSRRDRALSGHLCRASLAGLLDEAVLVHAAAGTLPASYRNGLQIFPVRTEEKIVGKKNRLETVVWLRETEEDRARMAMAEAQRHVAAATSALSAAKARATEDERRSASAAHWTLVESAHTRALQEARQAEHAVKAASDGLSQSRAHYLGAHTRTEALRRAIEARRAEETRAEAQAERKNMDEIAMLLRVAMA
jgi:flagellar export protein FliJ